MTESDRQKLETYITGRIQHIPDDKLAMIIPFIGFLSNDPEVSFPDRLKGLHAVGLIAMDAVSTFLVGMTDEMEKIDTQNL